MPPVTRTGDAFVGRAQELAEIDSALASVEGGGSEIVIVQGDPGIGKSSVLREGVERARHRGFEIALGNSLELEKSLPFAPVLEALGFSSVEEVTGDRPDETTEAEAIESLLQRIVSGVSPRLFAIEDLHWADDQTLTLLSRLTRKIHSAPFLLLVSTRPFGGSTTLRAFLRACSEEGARTVTLHGLEPPEVQLLVTETLGSPITDELRAEIARAHGNPLFIRHLLRAHQQTGSTRRAGSSSDKVLATVAQTVMDGLRHLPRDVFDALRAAAILGSTFDMEDLQALLQVSTPQVISSVDQAAGAGLLEGVGVRVRFVHELVREAVYSDMSLAARRAYHREAARHLAASGAVEAKVATHMALGAKKGDAEAVEWLCRAARSCLHAAPSVAVDFFEKALAIAARPSTESPEVIADFVVALVWCGRVKEAQIRAADLDDSRLTPQVRKKIDTALAQGLLINARWPEAAACFKAAASSSTGVQKRRLMVEAGFALSQGLDPEGASDALGAARPVPGDPSDDFSDCLSLLTESMVHHYRGDILPALDLCRSAAEIAAGSEDPELARRDPLPFYAYFLVRADRFDEAERILRDAAALGTEKGGIWDQPVYHQILAAKRYFEGRWDEALQQIEEGISAGENIDLRWVSPDLGGLLAQIAAHRGDLVTARRHLASFEGWESADAPAALQLVKTARAAVLDAQGDLPGALACLSDSWDELAEAGVMAYAYIQGPHLMRYCMRAGDLKRAEAVTEVLHEKARMNPEVPSAVAASQLARGMLIGDVEQLNEAVRLMDGAPRALPSAWAWEELGDAQMAYGNKEDAIESLRTALERYEALGARTYAARTRSALRDLGVRTARSASHRRPSRGWDALTPTESIVVELVTEGLTNPEIAQRMFVSPRTVQTHMKNIFRKLGSKSRAEVAAMAATRVAS